MGLIVERIKLPEANAILAGAHYLGPAIFRPEFALTTETRDALALFSAPVASHFTKSLDRPLELARLWRAEDFWKRGQDIPAEDMADPEMLRLLWGKPGQLSQFLSASLRWLRKFAPDVDCIFSYADPAARSSLTGRRHSGGIYTGANFAFLGETRGTDQWRTETGEIMSAAKCYRVLKTKSRAKIAALRPGWLLIEGEPKLLYVFPMKLSVAQVIERIGEAGRYKAVKPSPQPWD